MLKKRKKNAWQIVYTKKREEKETLLFVIIKIRLKEKRMIATVKINWDSTTLTVVLYYFGPCNSI